MANTSKENNLSQLENSVSVKKRGWFRRLFAFAGPAYLVSVGYMDPGNWATDIEGVLDQYIVLVRHVSTT